MNEFEENRPDPDALLSEINRSDAKHGKLKIFLGYAPGVGKTYTMLTEAHALKNRGIDVVIGYVETHKRAETNALIEGLEIIPRKSIPYKNLVLEEMDIDAILARKPQIVLIDEFAHSNVPGSRHPKRYLDVTEIMEQGIDVLTTVNIQHFESQNDIVAQITGVRVQETIPDNLFDEADEIKLIDVPLDELLQRLNEGKVYIPEQAQRAIGNFFRKGNLTALREITLRKVASKMDSELLNYMKARAIEGPWPVQDKILVCISPSPFSTQLVRRAYNLASESGIEWFAVYVSTPKFRDLNANQQTYLSDALNLASNLGAKIFTLSGSDVADEIIHFAKSKNITRILLGKPLKSPLQEFLNNSLTRRLMHDQSPFDVQLITPTAEKEKSKITTSIKKRKYSFHFRNYLYSFLLMILLTIFISILEKFIKVPSFEIIYIIAPVISALLYGQGPAIFSSFLSVFFYDYFFLDSRYSFTVNRPEHLISLLIFLSVSLVVSHLIKQSKNQYNALRMRLESLSVIEELSKELLNIPLQEEILKDLDQPGGQRDNVLVLIKTTILEEISKILVKYLDKVVNTKCVVLLKDNKNHLRVLAKSTTNFELSIKELSVADWSFSKMESAGSGTQNLTEVEWVFLPLSITSGNIIGVTGMHCSYKDLFLEQKNLINTVLKLSSMALANWI
jgi:two-component system sensor histidine kinase KdpD